MNKAILIGRLGNDPEVKQTSNSTVCNFSLATKSSWVDKEGRKQEKAEWHRIVMWGKQAEICGKYLKQGSQVYIEGELQTRSWEDKQGNKRYTTEINAKVFEMLGKKDESSNKPARHDDEIPF